MCNIILQSFKSCQLYTFLFKSFKSFSKLELLLIHSVNTLKNTKWPLKESFVLLHKKGYFLYRSQLLFIGAWLVMIALLRTISAQKNFLYYALKTYRYYLVSVVVFCDFRLLKFTMKKNILKNMQFGPAIVFSKRDRLLVWKLVEYTSNH